MPVPTPASHSVEFSIAGVDYDAMEANETIKASIKETVREEIAVQSGLPEEKILVQLRKGSIIVLVSFINLTTAQKDGGLTESINDRGWQQAVEAKVALRVQDMPDLVLIATGEQIVAHFRGSVTPPMPAPMPSPALPGQLWEDEFYEWEDEIDRARLSSPELCGGLWILMSLVFRGFRME